ncbi:MAG: tetratricopeptide repeat protein [Pseudomonadota bacterium]
MPENSQFLLAATQYYEQGQLLDAEASCRLALQYAPEDYAAMHMLGVVLVQLGRTFEGDLLLQHSIANDFAPVQFRINYARILASLNNHTAANEWLENACTLAPNDDALLNETGLALKQAGQLDKALEYFARSVELNPENIEYLFNLATVHKVQGRLDTAMAIYQQILALNPFHVEAGRYRASCFSARGDIDTSISMLKDLRAQHPDNAAVFDNLLMGLHYDATCSRDNLLTWHAEFDRQFSVSENEIRPHLNQPDAMRRLRVGYVSGDLCDHVLQNFFEPVLANHDAAVVDIYCYHNGSDDQVSARYKGYGCHWRNISDLDDHEAEHQICEDRIDILVDLSVHSGKNRLLMFAHKPAPVQVTWMGYASTTGLTAIDYRITDECLDPPEASNSFGPELPLRLGSNFICFQPPNESLEVNALPAKTAGYITFGSLNRQNKINRTVLELWARVLAAVPDSHLLVVDLADPQRLQEVHEIFAAQGVDHSRIEALPKVSLFDFMRLHHRVDVSLDPFPYTGGVTTIHGLWMGVPTITLASSLPIQRFGAMLLTNVGLSEFIAHSPEEYIDIARTIDLDRLATSRTELRGRLQRSPLADAPQLVCRLEGAYRHIWKTWCASRTPASGNTTNVYVRHVLHVGCGPKDERTMHSTFKEPGWREIRLDIDEACDPDIVASMLNMDAVPDQSMDAIWSSHNIEHLNPHEVPIALGEFFRVLKSGGFLLLALPDLQRVAAKVAEDLLEDAAYESLAGSIAPIDMIYGHRPSLAEGKYYMAHRTGFTARTLREHLEAAGFTDVHVEQVRRYDLSAKAVKP